MAVTVMMPHQRPGTAASMQRRPVHGAALAKPPPLRPTAFPPSPAHMESSARPSPPLPAAMSLFRLSSSPESGAETPRVLPRLLPRGLDAPASPQTQMQMPLAPATPQSQSQSLLGFPGLRKLRTPCPAALHDASPRSVAVTTPADDKEPEGKRKRRSPEPEQDAATTPRRRKRSNSGSKSRKPTYLLRKEEKDELVQQIRDLQAQVRFLQQSDASRSSGDSTRGAARCTDRKLFEQEMRNRLLREATRNHHFQLFSAQSALAELTHTTPYRCPINSFIRLGHQYDERRAALQALKAQKIGDAKQLMARRTQFLSTSAEPRRETSQFATSAGTLCSLQFDVVPLDASADAESVARVFDAVCGYVQSLESSHFTKSIDDQAGGVILGQLEMTTAPEMPTETNFVVFTELLCSSTDGPKPVPASSGEEQSEEQDAEPLAVLVVDSVDEDELHPYRPQEFLRLDTNAVVTLTRRPLVAREAENARTQQQGGLVLTRWALLTAHPTKDRVASIGAMDVVTQAGDFMSDGMMQAINKVCGSAVQSARS